MITIIKRYANVPGSPTRGEDEIKITSRFSDSQVYVSRLVKSSGKFGKRRYLIDKSRIREERTTHDPRIWQRLVARVMLARLTSERFAQIHPASPDLLLNNHCFNEDFVRGCITNENNLAALGTHFRSLSPGWQVNLTGKTYEQWKVYEKETNQQPAQGTVQGP